MRKDHPRVRAYGEVDELNCCLGLALSALPPSPALAGLRDGLARVQEELFIVGALLATPPEQLPKLGAPFSQGLPDGSASRLEAEIDAMSAELPALTRFIMPGGGGPGAWLHLARAVCRRAERETVALGQSESVPDGVVLYLNRLSDHLFTAARWANLKLSVPETQWQGLQKR